MKTHEYAAYAYGVVRSATAPETMVADADAYMNWCSQFFPGSKSAASASGSPARVRGRGGRADKGALAPVRERVPEDPPDARADARVEQVLQEDVPRVLHPHRPHLEHPEARLHQEDEERAIKEEIAIHRFRRALLEVLQRCDVPRNRHDGIDGAAAMNEARRHAAIRLSALCAASADQACHVTPLAPCGKYMGTTKGAQ